MKTTKKRLLCLVLAAAMALTLLPAMALAEGPAAGEGGGPAPAACTKTEGCTLAEGHEGECVLPGTPGDAPGAGNGPAAAPTGDVDADGYTLWDGTGEFPTSGKVRLTGDNVTINLSNDSGITIAGEVVLDLNGHTLQNFAFPSGKTLIEIADGAALTVEDNAENKAGKLLAHKDGAITVKPGGSFTLKSGTVTSAGKFAPVLVQGSFTMEGGHIKGSGLNQSSKNVTPVQVSGENACFKMTGGTISEDGGGNTGGLYLEGGASAVITGGTIELTRSSYSSTYGAVRVGEGCTAEISGEAKVLSSSRNSAALVVYGGGKAVISGNALIQNDGMNYSCAVDVYPECENGEGAYVEIKGGTIRNTEANGTAVKVEHTSAAVKGGALVFSGGLIENTNEENGKAIDVEGTLTMSGGTVRQVGANPAITMRNDLASDVEVNVTITGGEVTAAEDASSVIQEELKDKNSEVTGGVFSHPVTQFVADDKTEVGVSKDGDTVYAVGGSIAAAVSGAGEGDTVTVLKGDSVAGIPEGVTVKNETGNAITVNGTAVPSGGQVVTQGTPAPTPTPAPGGAPAAPQKANPKTGVCAGNLPG